MGVVLGTNWPDSHTLLVDPEVSGVLRGKISGEKGAIQVRIWVEFHFPEII